MAVKADEEEQKVKKFNCPSRILTDKIIIGEDPIILVSLTSTSEI